MTASFVDSVVGTHECQQALQRSQGCTPSRLRIGVLTVETTRAPPSAQYVVWINEMYTRKHGYAFYVERCSVSTARAYLWDDAKHHSISWSKSLFMLKHLPYFDYFVFLDADAMFVNHDISLEDVIDEQFSGGNLSMIVQSDCYDDDPDIGCWNRKGANTGFMIVKNTPRAYDVLRAWVEAAEDTDKCVKYHYIHPRDQMCFEDYVLPQFRSDVAVVDSPLWRGLDGRFIVHGYESRSPTFFADMALSTFFYLNAELFRNVSSSGSGDTPPWRRGHPRREWRR
jgi:hypothetical protein